MDFKEYVDFTRTTVKYKDRDAIYYLALGLGEAGEVQNKIKKFLRDTNRVISDEARDAIVDELGDLLYYTLRLADELGAGPDEVAERNIKKLTSRMERGVVGGSGDNR